MNGERFAIEMKGFSGGVDHWEIFISFGNGGWRGVYQCCDLMFALCIIQTKYTYYWFLAFLHLEFLRLRPCFPFASVKLTKPL